MHDGSTRDSSFFSVMISNKFKKNGPNSLFACVYCCFCTGPMNPDGIHLKSKRIENGLEGRIALPSKYCAFPGIINGGVISTLMDCHGNWTAAIALMDRACLPKPPLTLTASILVRSGGGGGGGRGGGRRRGGGCLGAGKDGAERMAGCFVVRQPSQPIGLVGDYHGKWTAAIALMDRLGCLNHHRHSQSRDIAGSAH